jgi:hypothetical protein
VSVDPAEYEMEEQYEQLYSELSEQVRQELQADRLQSFFRRHPDVVIPACHSLAEGKRLHEAGFPGAAIVAACTAIEVAMKQGMARAIVHGTIHHEMLADHVTEIVVGGNGRDAYRDLIHSIGMEFAGIDMNPKRADGPTTWARYIKIKKARDAIVHRGLPASHHEAAEAINVAGIILELLRTVVARIGLHMRDDGLVVEAFSAQDVAAMQRVLTDHEEFETGQGGDGSLQAEEKSS